jgi:hypothetical protein
MAANLYADPRKRFGVLGASVAAGSFAEGMAVAVG